MESATELFNNYEADYQLAYTEVTQKFLQLSTLEGGKSWVFVFLCQMPSN